MDLFGARRERARTALAELGADGLLITTLVNVRYLTGFSGSNGAFALGSDGSGTLFTDGRYGEQAAAECPGVDVVIARDLLAAAAESMSGSWAVETHTLSVDEHAALVEATNGVDLLPASRLVERLREVKDAAEIECLKRACAISVEALADLLTQPFAGRTERAVARDLEWRMFERGAEALAFETIVASGPNSAIPHHRPTDRAIEAGDLVKIDFGARVDGYHADCTRTFVVGPPADWQQEIHAAVQASQAAGVEALRTGVQVADVDHAARSVLEEAGWLTYFTTGVGHGVGLEIHEDPYIGVRNAGKLAACTTVTMEPGIYLPGRGGVRIEDTVLVGDTPQVLTPMTTDLLEIA
ncbi:MAG TPA: Xaa-Pro peptidase family protein [Aeromicrobium sp.]|nr:Xaa-Pro peptidase family protein [Aeromicrobium sp.]